jgi:hypothetical protein
MDWILPFSARQAQDWLELVEIGCDWASKTA